MLKRIVLAAIAAAFIAPAGAAAHTTSFPSQISFDLFECTSFCATPRGGPVLPNYVAGGEVNSLKSRCIPNRKVKLYGVPAGPPQRRGPVAEPPVLLDVDRTSDNGAWSGRFSADIGNFEHLRAKLVRKDIGASGHDHVCEADSALRPVNR